MLALAALGLRVGTVLLLRKDRTPSWVVHASVLIGSGLIAAGVFLSPNETAALGLAALFPLCAIGTLTFFAGGGAKLHAAAQLTAVAAALSSRDVSLGQVVSMVFVQLAIIVAVGRLVGRAADSVQDSLTGLPNRRSFDEQLTIEAAAAHRSGNSLSVAMVDVDHFKEVNDRGGHVAGDSLLVRLAQSWALHLPEQVTLSRHGGDEYALLARGYSAEQLSRLSEGLRALAAPASVSVGVAELEEREECASLVRRADSALYSARASGRSRTHTAQPDDEALRVDLAAAIAGGAVAVHFQPIVQPQTSQLFGVEALARWEHPHRGWISPAHFIALAERTGQVRELGRVLLEQASRDASLLRSAIGQDIMLTVNASGHELAHPHYADDVAEVLLRTGWSASHLVIEVTESTMEIASPCALASLERLRDFGVKVAIDDFGTGFSAFSHLDTLPADFLKLDAAFTADITTSGRRSSMLASLLKLCDELGLTVIAEGEESADHAELLSSMGCPLAQGYYFARPAPAEALLQHREAPNSSGWERGTSPSLA